MNINRKKILSEQNVKIILITYTLLILFRIVESVLICINYGINKEILFSELVGFCYDLFVVSPFLIGYILLSFVFSKIHISIARIVHICLLLFSVTLFLGITKYFVYQLVPLDIFLYNYSFNEILFTINTSNTNPLSVVLLYILIVLVLVFLIWFIARIKYSVLFSKIIYAFVILTLPIFLMFNALMYSKTNLFTLNKSFYFIAESIKYFNNSNEITSLEIEKFNKLYPNKVFIDKEYPLIHKVNNENILDDYFNSFDTSPNVVILIVEGLNDDFIHPYKGTMLMPFLSQLKDKSLYWKKCFTLGERSFAAVPCLLGGLPYGERGFTLEKKLPYHLSLVSILHEYNYYTTFFYGQGAWFHQKDRFFKYNNIDLIFDNSKFSDEFNKILVGKDNFFWGYNDKDLFNQSLKVIDTLPNKKRLDIYFTGSSHSPFKISNNDLYAEKLKQLTKEPYTSFFQTYSEYLQSILFVDDALKDFFDNYKKREDYANTIFIITGDHPMTEIPIANSLKRYHVPLIIFSDKLKESHSFSHIVSHLDVSQTILSLLQEHIAYTSDISTSLGDKLVSKPQKHSENLAFMNDNREIVDFLSGDYFLSGNNLFFVDSLLNLKEIGNDTILSLLTEKLNVFNNTNLYVTRKNKLISKELYCKNLHHKLLYTLDSSQSVYSDSEFINLANSILVPDNDLIFDVSLNIDGDIREQISIVYQIANENDSILLWSNFGINEKGITQAHIPIEKIGRQSQTLFFKSYIWNRKKYNITLSDIDILLQSAD